MAIITISRGSLSGGRAVANCLAESLGYPCVAREVLQDAAKKLGASEEALRGKFETPPGIWARLTHEREKYVVAVQTALAELCTGGDLVYHGLAGQFLLKGLPGVLKVRLIAPLEMRLRALTNSHHRMSREAAEEFIRNVDQERARWVKLVYNRDVTDASLYDLTVNLRTMSIDAACEAIEEAVAEPAFGTTEEVKDELEAFAGRCRERLDAYLSGS